MDKTEIFSILLSSIVLMIGAFLGYYHDPLDFSRSGSVLVVIAVLFTAFGAKRKLGDLIIKTVVKPLSVKMSVPLDPSDEEDRDLSEKIDKYFSKIRNEVERRLFRALIVEVVILVVGTFVWGFGDIIYKLI